MNQKPQKLKLQTNYTPKIQNNEEVEIYPNGIFKFFISKMIDGNHRFKKAFRDGKNR